MSCFEDERFRGSLATVLSQQNSGDSCGDGRHFAGHLGDGHWDALRYRKAGVAKYQEQKQGWAVE